MQFHSSEEHLYCKTNVQLFCSEAQGEQTLSAVPEAFEGCIQADGGLAEGLVARRSVRMLAEEEWRRAEEESLQDRPGRGSSPVTPRREQICGSSRAVFI